MSVTITLYAWYLLVWVAIGGVLVVPLNWLAYRQIHNAGPFLREWRRDMRRHGVGGTAGRFVLQVVAWPVAIWELAR